MAEQMKSKSQYIRVQGLGGDSTLGMVLPKEYCENLGIRKHDTVRVTQEGNILIVRRAVE
jgi:antitoxin component of MazEF toxin-antitoxin module